MSTPSQCGAYHSTNVEIGSSVPSWPCSEIYLPSQSVLTLEPLNRKASTLPLVPKALLELPPLLSGSQAPQGQAPLPVACPKLPEQNEALILSQRTMGPFGRLDRLAP